jgi:hypothetical protein
MRPQPHGVNFLFAFVADPCLDQVFAEDSTLEQKLMVLFEVTQRFVETARHRADRRRFFRFEIVQILLSRFTRIDLVLDSVQPRHEHGRKGEVRVCSRIGKTHLNPLGFCAW